MLMLFLSYKISAIQNGRELKNLSTFVFILTFLFGFPAIEEETENQQRCLVILFAHVSSTKQHEAGDLERQINIFKVNCPTYNQPIGDVGSGLNFKHKGLLSLFDAVKAGRVEKVVVTVR